MLEAIKIKARRLFESARGSHDWEHTLRVHRLCRHMGPAEGADMNVLLTAAYLHDIGRSHQDRANGTICHAQKGATMAKPLIEKHGFTNAQKDNIIHCIATHRFRGDKKPESIEAKVLFDADKLDAIGAVGIARAYLFAGELGAKLHNPDMDIAHSMPYSEDDTGYREYIIKLSKIKEKIMTGEGRKIASERHRFMVEFFNRFLEEYQGEK